MKRLAMVAAGAALLGLVVVPVIQSAGDGATADDVPVTTSPEVTIAPSFDITDAPVVRANLAVEAVERLEAEYPGALAGMEMWDDQAGMDVFVDTLDPQADAFTTAVSDVAGAGFGITVIPAKISLPEAQNLMSWLLTDEGTALLGQDVSYVSFTPSGGVTAVVQDVELARARLDRLGSDAPDIAFVKGPAAKDVAELH